MYSKLVILIFFAISIIICEGAPEPKIFRTDEEIWEEVTTQPTTEADSGVTTYPDPEFISLDTEDPEDNVIAQPSETDNVIASASSTSSASSNSINRGTTANQQANLLLLQQLQKELRRQQQLQQLQQQIKSQPQQPQQPQFSLDAMIKSVVKMFQVAKTKIDQSARTFRDFLQLFDRNKYVNIVPQASENNLVFA
ncbi:unnamed protein product [Orchesella dallaii]|uniref:Uncharacterized protein n=1 Tax=Orchesella dallaii TaxID=48710 RepID=A0ABP1PJ80_9HEXA